MSCCIFQVAIGDKPLYEKCIASVKRYCDRFGIDHTVLNEPVLKIKPLNSHRSKEAVDRLGYLPIFEKENAFHLLEYYDKVAIIDSDIHISPLAPNIFDITSPNVAFAGVIEKDMPLTPQYMKKVESFGPSQYASLGVREPDRYFNMGVMMLTQHLLKYLDGQTPEEFIRRREFERFVNGEGAWRWSTDQTLLNYWIKKEGIPVQELDWRWNCLFGAIREEKYPQAYFMHYFLSDKLPNGGADLLNTPMVYHG